MKSDAREATLLSLIVLGVVFGLGLGSFDWGLGRSVFGAVLSEALFLSMYAVAKRRGSARP